MNTTGKRCSKCGELKEGIEFHKCSRNKDGLASVCKACSKVRSHEKYLENKAKTANGERTWKQFDRKYKNHYMRENRVKKQAFVESLKTNCAKCGEVRRHVIQFHHVDPSAKSFELGRDYQSHGFAALENETHKCVCLCANCHIDFHYQYGLRPMNPIDDLNNFLDKKVTT